MEEAFLRALHEQPQEEASWLVLADWLEERGDPRGEVVRLSYQLRQPLCADRQVREERLRQLLAAGVKPCVPRFTNSIGMHMVLIPPGTFLMGSPESESERNTNERCPCLVMISRPFYLGIYPVTQAEYQQVLGNNPSHFNLSAFATSEPAEPTWPVEQVSWEEARAFCEFLTSLPFEEPAGRVYRLPTEVEWEYACRAGTTTPFSFGASLSATQANFDGNYPYGSGSRGHYVHQPSCVGSYPANAFGLYDMHGNVWEWCQDSIVPRGGGGRFLGSERVVRGGAWCSDGWECRSAQRGSIPADVRDNDVGFRVALTLRDWSG
jgi:uncharacterized protein (TIGR02996 family)